MSQSSHIKPALLIVDDDEDVRTQMKWGLIQDYDISLAEDRNSALEQFQAKKPSVVTLDLGLPPKPASVEEGFATLTEMLSINPHAKIIVISGRGEKEHAIEAIGQGAYDYLSKPIEIDVLKIVLNRTFHISELEQAHNKLQMKLEDNSFEGMLGTCSRMQEIFSIIRKISTTEAPVLVLGESGTGKELVAKAVHQLSSRRENSFVVINCGAIPENLLESELFGHEKGAFTGAHVQRKGRIELAHNGTLFLDEIGELPLPLQVKLLRFLQEQTIERVGGRKQITVDARIIAATNKNLKKGIKEGTFREDLYFRLGVISIELPSLKEREGDILLLAKAFLNRYSEENNKILTGFTNKAINALESYSWPGNVRELENRIKRAVIMAEGKKLTPADLEMETPRNKYKALTLKEARDIFEKELILNALNRNNGNISKTSSELGISRPTLYDLINKLGIPTD